MWIKSDKLNVALGDNVTFISSGLDILARGSMKKDALRDIDLKIVDVIDELEVATPALVAKRIKRDRQYVANRLAYLSKEGVVEKLTRGVYRIVR